MSIHRSNMQISPKRGRSKKVFVQIKIQIKIKIKMLFIMFTLVANNCLLQESFKSLVVIGYIRYVPT